MQPEQESLAALREGDPPQARVLPPFYPPRAPGALRRGRGPAECGQLRFMLAVLAGNQV